MTQVKIILEDVTDVATGRQGLRVTAEGLKNFNPKSIAQVTAKQIVQTIAQTSAEMGAEVVMEPDAIGNA